jgi:hypothetical protein
MKNLFILLIFVLLLPASLYSQNVPNGGFETWSTGNPDSWYVDNVPGYGVPVTQGTAHSGSYSAKGTVMNSMGGPLAPVIRTDLSTTGFPVTQRFKSVEGYYQFTPQQGDKFAIDIIMFKSGKAIAHDTKEITAVAASWTPFNVDFTYLTNEIPDKCFLQFLIMGPTTSSDYHLNSAFLLDDVNITGTATSLNDMNFIPAKFSLEQNYPNPFNPSSRIKYELPENSFVTLTVYNSIGKEVISLVNGVKSAGMHEIVFDASDLNSGVYFYTLKAGNNFQTRKMILMK